MAALSAASRRVFNLLLQNATMVEIPPEPQPAGSPKRNFTNRKWLSRHPNSGWRLFTTHGPTWAYNFATKRWVITLGMFDALDGPDYTNSSLLDAFDIGAAAPTVREQQDADAALQA